jgi:hypothetical protein
VIYWYDLDILLRLWESGLTIGSASAMAACATLKYPPPPPCQK